MKNKTNKRAFTIVELVIVIAVIAVLAGVLIPTFSSLVKKAQTSKDTQLIRNLNTALVVDKTSGNEHNTMTDALEAAKEAGYLVDKINASNTDNEILWDSVNDVFCYLEKDATKPLYIPETTLEEQNIPEYKYWKISNEVNSKYSTYLFGYEGNGIIETTKGLDVGETEGIISINYNRSNESGDQVVVIRTNEIATKLIINAAQDEVFHFGIVSSVDIIAVKNSSYVENGEVFGDIRLESGNLVIKDNAIVNAIALVNKSEGNTATAAPTATVEGKVNVVIVDTNQDNAHITISANAKVNEIGKSSSCSNEVNTVITNNSSTPISNEAIVLIPFIEKEITSDTKIREIVELENIVIDEQNKIITVKNIYFKASANKKITVEGYESYTISFEHCVFDKVILMFESINNSDCNIIDTSFFNVSGTYCLNFSKNNCGNVTIKDTKIIDCGRGMLIRTPNNGHNVLIENCVFELLTNSGTDKARAIQIATENYYYAKKTDEGSINYYREMSQVFSGSNGNVLNGKISIINNTFKKASYAIYIYEAQTGGGFTFGNSTQEKLFDKLSGNLFESEVMFKYGCSDIGDGRSYTNKGYNTGLISSDYGKNENVINRRNAIENYKAEDYWDQWKALMELESNLK